MGLCVFVLVCSKPIWICLNTKSSMYAKSSVTEHVFLFVRNTLFCLKYILHSERCQQTQKKDRVIDKGTEQGKWQQHIPF